MNAEIDFFLWFESDKRRQNLIYSWVYMKSERVQIILLFRLISVPGRQFPISHWISQEDLAFTSKVGYRHGRIVIQEEGLYYVYSQLSFLEVFDNPNTMDSGSQSLSHYIYRYNIIYPHGGEESMIQNSITKCWGQNKAFGEYTSYLGAVFHLRQGDELFVKVSNLTLIVREPKLNYFGLFKVN